MHVSSEVLGFPSLQALLLGVAVQPLMGSQALSVHSLPSSQLTTMVATHCPSRQVSPCVQASSSSQGCVL